jgi:1-acyl-sn-glycerol-3-phosphate acyltransferase
VTTMADEAVDVPADPSEDQINRLVGLLEPLRRVTRPKVYGIENVPEGGSLLVGNHTIYGFLDLPFMMAELWQQRHIAVRGLGDHAHYAIPVWRDLLTMAGMVRGTRDNVRALMHDRQEILVFPGGAREVFKQRGEAYRLIWKQRLGFARLAIEFGYPIVPFAAVGAEEMLDVLADERTPVVGQVGGLIKRLVGLPLLPPIVRGIGLTAIPRPERLYFWFGEPIKAGRFGGDPQDGQLARALRDEVRVAVESGIAFLRAERDKDPNRRLRRRLRGIQDRPGVADDDPDAWFVRCAFDAWNTMGPNSGAAWMSPWITLEDPPEQPDFRISRGREAVLARLEEVCEVFGGRWARVREARTVGDDVLVTMDLRSGPEPDARKIGRFHQLVTVAQDQITRMRVFTNEGDLEAADQPRTSRGSRLSPTSPPMRSPPSSTSGLPISTRATAIGKPRGPTS